MSRFAAIIFDLDGLILDTEAAGEIVWRKLCAEQGFELSSREYQTQAVGKGLEFLLNMLSEKFGPGFDIAAVRNRRPIVWREQLDRGVPIKPGFEALLSFLEMAKIPRAIATSTERPLVEARLRAAAIDARRFQAMVTGDEVSEVKPSPEIYLRAAELLGVAPKECLALEDSSTGALAAQNAGIPVIIVPDLVQPSDSVKANAVRVESSLLAVLAYIRQELSV